MRIKALLLTGALALLASPAFAACGDPGAVEDLTGATFAGRALWSDGDTYDMTFVLKADCKVRYSYRDIDDVNATWEQTEGLVLIQLNDGYSSYLGLLEGDKLSGVMSNKAKDEGEFEFKRAKSAGKSGH